MPWYRTGTVAVTNGSPNVVGTGTLFLSQSSVGDIFVGPDLGLYEITAVPDDLNLSVKQLDGTAAYAGATLSAQDYAIIRNFTSTLPAQLAASLAALMASYHVTLDELVAWLSGTGTVEVHDAVGNVYNVKTPAQLEAEWSGLLSKSVAGGVDVTLTTAEAGNLILEFTGTLTANINVIVPAAARMFLVKNGTTGAFTLTVKTAAGTGIGVTQNKRALLECDGTNVVSAIDQLSAIEVAESFTARGSVTLGDNVADVLTATTDKVRSSLEGGLNFPLQSSFLATFAGATNVTGDGTAYTIPYATEIFDQNADFNVSTYTFTAPVAGRYLLSASIQIYGLLAAHNDQRLFIVTSNRSYGAIDGSNAGANPFSQKNMKVSVVADMDAGDTAYATITCSGGTKVVDVDGAIFNQFCGQLVA